MFLSLLLICMSSLVVNLQLLLYYNSGCMSTPFSRNRMISKPRTLYKDIVMSSFISQLLNASANITVNSDFNALEGKEVGYCNQHCQPGTNSDTVVRLDSDNQQKKCTGKVIQNRVQDVSNGRYFLLKPNELSYKSYPSLDLMRIGMKADTKMIRLSGYSYVIKSIGWYPENKLVIDDDEHINRAVMSSTAVVYNRGDFILRAKSVEITPRNIVEMAENIDSDVPPMPIETSERVNADHLPDTQSWRLAVNNMVLGSGGIYKEQITSSPIGVNQSAFTRIFIPCNLTINMQLSLIFTTPYELHPGYLSVYHNDRLLVHEHCPAMKTNVFHEILTDPDPRILLQVSTSAYNSSTEQRTIILLARNGLAQPIMFQVELVGPHSITYDISAKHNIHVLNLTLVRGDTYIAEFIVPLKLDAEFELTLKT